MLPLSPAPVTSEFHTHATAADGARRKETILVIRLVEDVFNASKQHHRYPFRLSSLVAHKYVTFRVPSES